MKKTPLPLLKVLTTISFWIYIGFPSSTHELYPQNPQSDNQLLHIENIFIGINVLSPPEHSDLVSPPIKERE